MNSVDWTAALKDVEPASVLLPLLFLTLPGLALCRGLRRFRKAAAQRRPAAFGGKSKAGGPARSGLPGAGDVPSRAKTKLSGQVLLAKAASVVTMLAMMAAGLGLVPLALVAYKAVATAGKYAPAVIGLVLVLALLAKGFLMVRDLKDGRVDHPALWLAPIPILAVLILAAPVVWGQVTDQAGHTAQMVFGGTEKVDHKPTKKASSKKHKKAAESRGGSNSGG